MQDFAIVDIDQVAEQIRQLTETICRPNIFEPSSEAEEDEQVREEVAQAAAEAMPNRFAQVPQPLSEIVKKNRQLRMVPIQ